MLTADHRLALIGAGSAVFTRGLLADLISATDLGSWEIRLVDTERTHLSVATDLANTMVAARRADNRISVSAALDRREALVGADFVVSCVGVGGRAGWQLDHSICQQHGVFQPVGDSVMPGGISRLLRTVPVMVQIAQDVARLAPNAHFFNYANPMTANVTAMSRYAGMEVTGLCHGVHHVQRELSQLIGKPLEETSTLYAGINHLTFIYDFRWQGRDAWPMVREILDRDLVWPPDPDLLGDIWRDGSKSGYNPFSWEIFRTYGAYPAASDRHVVEFFPERWPGGNYYGKTLGVDAFSVPEILAWGEDRYQEMRAQASGEVALDQSVFERSSGEQEQLIAIIASILNDRREMFSVNVLNRGSVPGLSNDVAVEIPAVTTGRGLRCLRVPDLGTALTAVLARRLASVELAIEAAMTGSVALVVEAMLADGAVTDPKAARALTADLLDAQRAYLPNFS